MQHHLLTNKIKVIMENKYQPLLGIIRSHFGKQLSMYSFLDYVREGTLSTDDVRDFVKGVCDALDMKDWADVLAGTALGIGSAWVFTRPLSRRTNISLLPATFGDDSRGLTAIIRF